MNGRAAILFPLHQSRNQSVRRVLLRFERRLEAERGTCRSGESWYGDGMKFRVHVEADEDGVFVAECPTLPGCISQGDTREAALANIKDAIAGYIFSLEKHGEAVPLPVNEEVVEVAA